MRSRSLHILSAALLVAGTLAFVISLVVSVCVGFLCLGCPVSCEPHWPTFGLGIGFFPAGLLSLAKSFRR